jgi:hypothetical protein
MGMTSAIGHGSTFFFTLPINAAAPEQPEQPLPPLNAL